jgi:DNA polymerase I-like protein with 3'-5' exonuclease and polymerase domains/uracil-DNA glycosylase
VEATTKPKRVKHVFTDPAGNIASMKSVTKVYRDVLINHHGTVPFGKGVSTIIDFQSPLVPQVELIQAREKPHLLVPGKQSPICQKCGLHEMGSRHPFFEPRGPDKPLITIVFESVSPKEDARGELGSDGPTAFLAKLVDDMSKETNVTSRDVRWAPITRCAARGSEKPNFDSKGNYCKHFLVQEFQEHPPRIIVPIGSVALGLLCHKSNAQDWSGKLLTYRGWPDDWLIKPLFMLPRQDPMNKDGYTIGHPLFGPPPNMRMPLMPLQAPRIIYGSQNPQVILRWKNQLKNLLKLAASGVSTLTFDRPWYCISCNPDEIITALHELIDNPGTLTSYDTETNGLKPWLPGSKIVFMMFRWTNAQGEKRSIGFPWDYEESPLLADIPNLAPIVLEALYRSIIAGHNGTFDALFTIANVLGCDLNKIAPRFKFDTWHMVYTMRQVRGTLSLDMIAYDWVPDLAGYEEDMTLLIDLHKDTMHPESGQHAHFARCPAEKWDTHLKPYVMGDVEVCYVAREKIQEKLNTMPVYKLPLAHPKDRGRFRLFQAQSRADVYKHVVSPASRMLIKLMARGMQVDIPELARQEDMFPKQLREMKERLRSADENIVAWCDQKVAIEPGWELDLEKPEHLRELLFDVLNLPVERLTNSGVKIYGEPFDETVPKEELIKYSKIDKFTLNRIAVKYPRIRPLQEYRRAFKAYSSYIRPIRNAFLEGFDKKRRDKDPHLMRDGRVHAQFLLTGTRSGRLASRDPNLQQLPRDSVIKRIYCSRFGEDGFLYQGDLSQIELRLIAAACGDQAMVDAYWKDIDLHSLSMSRIFNLPYDHCIKDHVMWLQKNKKDKEAKDMELKRKISKCVHPDTLISVNGKIIRIGHLAPVGALNDTFYPLADINVAIDSTRTAKALQFYNNGHDRTLLVSAKQSLTACSERHRFVLNDGRQVMAKDLKKGDVLKSCQAMPCGSSAASMSFNPFLTSKMSGNVSTNFSLTVDSELAWVLGAFVGDGCANPGFVSICFGGRDDYASWGDTIEKICQDVGFETERRPVVINSTGSPMSSIHLGGKAVQRVFQRLGVLDLQYKKVLKIPDFVFNAGIDVKLSFLAGLIDTDGSVTSKKHGTSSGIVTMNSKSWQLIQDVSVLCQTLGLFYSVSSGYTPKFKRWYFTIRLSKRSSQRLNGYLRCFWKSQNLDLATIKNKSTMEDNDNVVRHVIDLDRGPLVDIQVDTEEHLYLTNGQCTHNTINFLTGYGGGAYGLQATLANDSIYFDIEECEKFLEAFFDSYPALRQYLGHYKRFIADNAVAVSIMGRVRVFEEVLSDNKEFVNKALRAGCNHLIQATASDMMLVCLCVIEELMRDANLESMLVSTVHDSLVIDALRSEIQQVHEIVYSVFNNIPDVMRAWFGPDADLSWMIVPFGGDCEIGKNYLDTKKIPNELMIDWDSIFEGLKEAA